MRIAIDHASAGSSTLTSKPTGAASWRLDHIACTGTASVWQEKFGGWQLNLVMLARGGLPFTVTQQQGVLSNGTANRRNRAGNGQLSNPVPDRWWDLAAFVPTTDNTGTYGTSGRNILRQPDQVNVDFSLVKSTRFGDRFEHQFRIELFNAVNHPQFGKPASTLGASDQGVISSLLFNTPMRQIQFAIKFSF